MVATLMPCPAPMSSPLTMRRISVDGAWRAKKASNRTSGRMDPYYILRLVRLGRVVVRWAEGPSGLCSASRPRLRVSRKAAVFVHRQFRLRREILEAVGCDNGPAAQRRAAVVPT